MSNNTNSSIKIVSKKEEKEKKAGLFEKLKTNLLGQRDNSSKSKKSSRKERKQAERVRKEEERMKAQKQKQIEDFRAGKASSKELEFDHRPFWNKTLSEKTYSQFKEMGDSEEAIANFQMKRILFSLAILVMGLVGGYFIHSMVAGIGIVVAIVIYVMKGRSVDGFYKNWKFERQLAFSKFTRLVIPYLKSSEGNMALYTIFNRVVKRMDDPEDKNNLYQLMGEMGNDPADDQPFLDFAERSSGTDMSHLFMTTIFDFQQSTFDVTVIDELGKLASDDMMTSVDEIIEFKLQRFAMFPTKIVMSSFLLVAGLAVSFMISSFQGLDMGGMDFDIDPSLPDQSQIEEVQTEEAIEVQEIEDDSAFIISENRFV